MKDNSRAVAAAFRKKSDQVYQDLAETVLDHAVMLEADIKARQGNAPAPQAPTGDYRRSWGHKVFNENHRIIATVGTSAPQARRLEYGFYGLKDRAGRLFWQQPRPHLRPAVNAIKTLFESAVSDVVKKR